MRAVNVENIKVPWTLNVDTILRQLEVDDNDGLDANEVSERLHLIGPNTIESSDKTSAAKILANQFVSPFVLLLVVAAGLSFYFNEWLDGIAILAVIVINALIGFIMEFRAQKSMEALRRLGTVAARVIRDGNLIEIPSEEVVPGDILFVESGDMITADARVIKCSQLETNESALTGESLPVTKHVALLPEKVVLAERNNMLYKGTFVTRGNGTAVVVETGMSTELGSIAHMVQTAKQVASPLEKKIQVFSKKLIWITVALVIIIFIAGLMNGQRLVQMLETSIALAVAAIPEGLPIVSTLALAAGMLQMAKRNVIVKKLSSVETLGGTSVICTDKTGTLTQNKIAASFIQLDNAASNINVDIEKRVIHFNDNSGLASSLAYSELNRIAALCNTASYQKTEKGEKETGDPLEVGLLKMIYCTPTSREKYLKSFPKEDEIPFSSDTRVMATLHRVEQGFYIAAKGAIEELLNRCTSVIENDEITRLTDKKRRHWLNTAETKAESGLRMLAFAFRYSSHTEKDFLKDLTLAGLIGFIDPARPEVPAALDECRSAGIRVMMITGDHPATAKNIAMQLRLITHDDEVLQGVQMKPYHELNEAEKEQWLNTSVFARVTPAHKLDLVTLLQEKKLVVGMTGDGVNDAPALKKADIGIAMGQKGTQVAQEVSDMVLKDDSFSSIVTAVRQGRVIFDNIRRFVIYLLSCNLSELLIIATAAILNLHFQLFPLQILFINLVTDVLPALALGVTEGGPDVMQRKPYSSQAPIIDKERWTAIFTYSIIISITTLAAVFVSHEMLHGKERWNVDLCNNILFYSLIFSQILHVFNMSFDRQVPFFKSEVFRNKYVWYALISCILIVFCSYWILPIRKTLHVSLYGWQDFSIVMLFSFLSLGVTQIFKRFRWTI